MNGTALFLLTFTFILIHIHSYSQVTVSFGGGYTQNEIETKIHASNTEVESNNGLQLSILCKKEINRTFSLRTGIDYIQKNYSQLKTGAYAGAYNCYKNLYLQIPLILQVKAFEKNKIRISGNLGIYSGYWLVGKIDGVIPNIFDSTNSVSENGTNSQYFSYTSYSTNYKFKKQRDNRFEYGFITGINISYQHNRRVSFFLEPSLYYSETVN
jgi:hypothetical protein